MKINGIRFMNLNSLKGMHEIRFDQAPFTESGIFAITGPTGAGKTTLLDAITVALYGKVHRHQKDVFEIMTRHTAESFAEVEFEVDDHIYRSKWSIKRSRGKADGQLQTQKMELADVRTGKILVEHPLNEVREEIVRLCGLDYNQFLRSVILSQGDFTRFLKADENERSELLEKITDTGIYSAISMATFEKAREEKIKLDQLRGKLQNVVLLSAEEAEELTRELKTLSAANEELKKTEDTLRDQLEWLNKLDELKAKMQQQLAALTEAELFSATHASRFEKLQQHLRAMVHRPALAELTTIEDQKRRIGDDLKEVEALHPATLSEEKAISEAFRLVIENLRIKEGTMTTMEPEFERITKMDVIIDQAEKQMKLMQGNFDGAVVQVSAAENAVIQTTGRIQDTRKQLQELSQWLAAHADDLGMEKQVLMFRQFVQQLDPLQVRLKEGEQKASQYQAEQGQGTASIRETAEQIKKIVDQVTQIEDAHSKQSMHLQDLLADQTLEELELAHGEIPGLISRVEQQYKLSTSYLKIQELIVAGEERILAVLASHEVGKQRLLLLEAEYKAGADQLKYLQNIYELEVRVGNYEKDRQQLKPQEPCPLCGALHHPFVEGKYENRVTEAEARRDEHATRVEDTRRAIDEQRILVNTLVNQTEALQKEQAILAEKLDATIGEFASINEHLPKPLDIARPQIINVVLNNKITAKQKITIQIQSVRAARQQIQILEKDLQQLKDNLVLLQNKKNNSQLAVDFAAAQLQVINTDIAGLRTGIAALEVSAMNLLKPLGIQGQLHESQLIIAEMERRYAAYVGADAKSKHLELEYRQQETELRALHKEVEEKRIVSGQQEVQLKEAQLELYQLRSTRVELFGIKDPQVERQQLSQEINLQKAAAEELRGQLQHKQQSLKVLEDRQLQLNSTFLKTKELFNAQLEKLTARLQVDGLGSLSDLNDLFLPDNDAEAFSNLQKEATQRLASIRAMLNATETELEAEARRMMTDKDKDELSVQLMEQSETRSALQQEQGKINHRLEQDEQLRLQYTEVARQINDQQLEVDRFQKLSALIGSADGKKFSRFAQGLTLARLTELANRHLQRLSERYTILKSPGRDLDLQIIDGYQADVVRPMSTLSGGESFLVSLALALGLSDLASRKVQINSLFIDEGFGTLDAETLDTAITALENLQASGKNIGIISHIEALKERVGIQVQLIREAGGTSKLALYNYGQKVG